MEKPKSLIGNVRLTAASIAVTAVPILAGSYKGFCDVKGIPYDFQNTISRETLENVLRFGPALLSLPMGVATGLSKAKDIRKNTEEKYPEASELKNNIKNLELYGAVGGGVTAAGLAGLLTGFGYGVGYIAGKLI